MINLLLVFFIILSQIGLQYFFPSNQNIHSAPLELCSNNDFKNINFRMMKKTAMMKV